MHGHSVSVCQINGRDFGIHVWTKLTTIPVHMADACQIKQRESETLLLSDFDWVLRVSDITLQLRHLI